MTASDRILALFSTDEDVLRTSEILHRSGLTESSVRKALWRLKREGRLHNIKCRQWARARDAQPLSLLRSRDFRALAARIEKLEAENVELRIAVRRIREDIDA